jgi:hypothetical protein
MQIERLTSLLVAVQTGETSVDEALVVLRDLPYETVDDYARIDNHRALRTGLPEVIYGAGKTADQVAQLLQVLTARNGYALATRVTPEQAAAVQVQVPAVRYHTPARILALGEIPPPSEQGPYVCVATAGTSDLPVAEEAALLLELWGQRVVRVNDVGVAGVHRLLAQRATLAEAALVMVVAGMEGALASVVGGLISVPVIAVPTSVGYGASFGGLAALLAMLNSCAPGVAVVNIDNGFGAAALAMRIMRGVR